MMINGEIVAIFKFYITLYTLEINNIADLIIRIFKVPITQIITNYNDNNDDETIMS